MESVDVFDVPGKGRGLRTTKEVWAGDVLFAEPSFAAVVFDSMVEHVCHSCFRRQPKLHRCGQCKFAQYCNRTCQRQAWEEHKLECAAIKAYGKVPNENIRLAARILWRVDKEGGIVSDTQLISIDDLENHVSDMLPEDLKDLKVDVLNFLDYWPRYSKPHKVEDVSHVLGLINCNGFSMSDHRGLNAVGVGLFPNLCLINHDCWPNCTVILNNGKIELRALGKISTGEELTVAYVDFLNVSSNRQQQLKQQYFFDCTCKHCTEHIKDDLMMAPKEVDDNKPSEEEVKEVTEHSLKMLEKMEKARVEGDYHEVVKISRECLEKQEKVLADTHLYMLRVLSTASEVLSYLQFIEEAATYSRRMVEGYMKLYHPNNAALGMATMRAGVTHWQAGLIEVGHSMICKAYSIIMITHGPTHPITQDLEAMRRQTEMELRMFQQNEYVYHSMREAALKNQPMSMRPEPVEEGIKNLFRRK